MNSLFEAEHYITKIVLACRVLPESGQLIHRNRPSHGLAYHCTGEKYYRFADGKVLKVGANDLIFLPKGSSYRVEVAEDGICYAINFQCGDEFAAEPFAVHFQNSSAVLQYFKQATRAFFRKEDGYIESICRNLYTVLCETRSALQEGYTGKRRRELLKIATDYIAERYTAEPITVPALAKQCGVSEAYLRRLFQEAYHQTPVEYINRLRLSYAYALLSSGEGSVTDACFMSGFNDAGYFSRVFKRQYGYPPQELLHGRIPSE